MYLLIFIIALFSVILLSKIKIITKYEEKKFLIKVYFWGILVFDNSKEKKKRKSSSHNLKKTGETKKEEFNLEKLKGTVDKLTGLISDLKKILSPFKRKLKASEFIFDLTFGMPDAAETGIATGIIWAAIGTFYPVFDLAIEIKDPVINVNPKFNCEYLNIKYSGVYTIRIFNIVYPLLKNIKTILKYINGGA